MEKNITLLFLAANPVDMGLRLRLDNEYKAIAKATRGGRYGKSIQLATEWSVTTAELANALLENNPRIVHFSGHGSDGIVLEDDTGKARPVTKEALARLFRELADNIGLVVLNACFTDDQANWLREIVDYTIGMSGEIRDRAAIAFSSALYEALSHGRTVRSAFELALARLEIEGISGSNAPRLVVRDGVDESLALLPLKEEPGAVEHDKDELMSGLKSAQQPPASRIEQVVNASGTGNLTFASAGNLRIGTLNNSPQRIGDSDERPANARPTQPQAVETIKNPQRDDGNGND